VNDVEEGDTLLIDGISLFWLPFHDVELYFPFFSPLEFQCFC
jgi:hypothetical protein